MSDTAHAALAKDGLRSQGSPPEALLFPPAIIFVLCSSLFIALFGCVLQLKLLTVRRVPAFPGEGQGTVPSPSEQHTLIGMFGAPGRAPVGSTLAPGAQHHPVARALSAMCVQWVEERGWDGAQQPVLSL